MVSRLTANRFAIVFPRATAEQAQSVLAVLQASLEVRPPAHEDRPTISAGISELAGIDDAPGVLRRAEQALRQARGAGGGSVFVAAGP